MATNKYFKCPYCGKKFTREALCRHLESKHMAELPEGFTPLRVTFHVVNRKDMSYRRPCRVCKQPTEWDENKGRYNFLCGSRECYEKHVEKMREDMGDKLGINRQTATPEGLEKMLANRKISGKYKFENGHEVSYTGSYEKKALEFFDKIMHIKPEDLMVPGPILKYELDNINHIYIPDMYYIPYNLIIEVKDGGNRPNQNPQWKETRRKQIAKEKFIVENTDYNYIRLTNNDFSQVLAVFADLKMSSMEEDPYRVIHINEAYIKNTDDIYYNKDKFDSGEINLCFITGHSGSGKSTMGRNMSDNNIEHYELDDIIFTKDHFTMNNLKEYGDLIYSFFNGPGKKYYITEKEAIDNKIPGSEYEDKLFPDFIHYAMKYAKNHKDKKYVIEGVWIYKPNEKGDNLFVPEEFKDYAFYIKGTSLLISKIRAAKRDSDDSNNKSGKIKAFCNNFFKKKWKYYLLDEKRISKFRDYFSSKMIHENTPPTSIAPMVDFRSNDIIVLQYLHKNSFSGESKLAIADNPKFDTIFTTDNENVLTKMNKTYLSECKYSSYILRDSKDRINTILKEGEVYTDLYESIFGHKQYTSDQILFESNIEEYKDYYVDLVDITESITNYILGKGDDK